jgi:hypothetical protein
MAYLTGRERLRTRPPRHAARRYSTKGYLYVYIATVYEYPFVCVQALAELEAQQRAVQEDEVSTSTKGYLYVYIHTVYKYPFVCVILNTHVLTPPSLHSAQRTAHSVHCM